MHPSDLLTFSKHQYLIVIQTPYFTVYTHTHICYVNSCSRTDSLLPSSQFPIIPYFIP